MKIQMKETIAIYVSGGVVQEVRSNNRKLKVEIVDQDNDPETSEEFWNELSKELEFVNL